MVAAPTFRQERAEAPQYIAPQMANVTLPRNPAQRAPAQRCSAPVTPYVGPRTVPHAPEKRHGHLLLIVALFVLTLSVWIAAARIERAMTPPAPSVVTCDPYKVPRGCWTYEGGRWLHEYKTLYGPVTREYLGGKP